MVEGTFISSLLRSQNQYRYQVTTRDTAESNKSVATWKKFLIFTLIIHSQHAMQQCAIIVLQKGLFSNNLKWFQKALSCASDQDR